VEEFMDEAQQIATGWAARRHDLPTILRGMGAEQAELEERVAALAQAAAGTYERIRLPLLAEIRERGDGGPA
jgi:hypothetical protein